jgi:septum formation protein
MNMLAFSSFTVCPAAGPEKMPEHASPEGAVKALASQKAEEVASRCDPYALIIAADTVVVCDGRILGKPRDEEDAFRMLRLLSGRTHEVYTGLCLKDKDSCVTEAERTAVRFRTLSDSEIRRYIETGEPMDKAGAYGIQGKAALFVEAIEGDYYNVVGLPLCRLGRMLAGKGVPVL